MFWVKFMSTVKLGYAAVIASAVLFSAKSVFIKMCYAYGTPPMVLMALRTGFSLPFFIGMAIAPFFMVKNLPAEQKPIALNRGEMLAVIGLGLLGYYVASILDVTGLQYVSAGTERLILYLYPSFVVLFSSVIFKKPFPKSMILPLVLSYAGIALAFSGELQSVKNGRPYFGGFLILMSAVSYALFLVGQGKMILRVGPQRLSAYAMLGASVAVFLQFIFSYRLSALIQPMMVYKLAFLTAIFCTVLPVYLFGYGVKLIGSGRAAVLSTLGPVSTFALAGVFLKAAPGYLQGLGLTLVVLGSLTMGKKK